MRIVRAYRLGDDGVSIYRIPGPKQSVQQMNDTWGSVYNLIERRMIEGGIPKPIERLNPQEP